MPHAVGRRQWWAELPLIVVVYALYSAARFLARGGEADAVANGLALLRLENALWLDAEVPLNRWFTDAAWLGVPADFAYASLHYVCTVGVLVWLWRRHPAGYLTMRSWLLVSTLIALVGFALFPTCPPRLLDPAYGFVDTMAQYGDYGWWGAEASAPEGLGAMTNQYAAMPSLHVGWAVWCGVAVWRYAGRSRWLRAAAVGYPLLTTVIVMGTANHYLLDAVAGAAVLALGWPLTRPLTRWAAKARLRPRPAGGTAPGAVAAGDVGAGDVSAGCETAARTAVHREAPEATVDDDNWRHPDRAGITQDPAPTPR